MSTINKKPKKIFKKEAKLILKIQQALVYNQKLDGTTVILSDNNKASLEHCVMRLGEAYSWLIDIK